MVTKDPGIDEAGDVELFRPKLGHVGSGLLCEYELLAKRKLYGGN